MKLGKHFRQFVLASVAFVTVSVAPIDIQQTLAAEVETEAETEKDFSSTEFRETAKQYLGTPYVYGGTTTSGFDCSGYVRQVFSDLDISLPRTSSSMYDVGEAVKSSELLPGDLLFFNTSGSGVSHVGIYYGDGKFIHSQTGKGVSLTPLDDPYYWAKRYVGAKRVADVALGAQS